VRGPNAFVLRPNPRQKCVGVGGREVAGMSEAMFGELMAVVGMANETNRLANGYRVPIDPAFDK